MDEILAIVSRIKSRDLEEKISAIEKSESIIAMIINAIVSELENDNNCYLIAERISNIQDVLYTSLNNMFENTKKGEVKELIALLLFNIGSHETIDYLIQMIKLESVHSGLAARDLAERGVKEAVTPILEQLKVIDTDKIDLVVAFIQGLKKLNAPIPDDIKNRFKSEETPWQISSLL